MRTYHRINLLEREEIYRLLRANQNQTTIAKSLGRSKSTISREIKRCICDPLGYIPDRANEDAKRLLRRNLGLFRSSSLLDCVVELLKEGWSPEQISGRLKLEKSGHQVSHETIYQFIYSPYGQELRLYKLLTKTKPKRTKRYSRKPKKSHIPESARIDHRPKSIDKRKTKGHWEADLVVFRSVKSANVTTAVERKSRFAKLIYNKSKYSDEVTEGIRNKLSLLPPQLLASITFDRGSEFAAYGKLAIKQVFFCNPHSPWQKGSNENFNGRLRRYLPKTFNPKDLSQGLLDEIEQKFNNQPRKCLGYRTPAEVFWNQKHTHVALGP